MNSLNDSAHADDGSCCPFIGLHDDPQTCLAYPSFWNYCYRARPPASVKVSHQTEACLSRGFANCPIYLSPPKAALPHVLRGAVPLRKRRPTAMGFAMLSLLILLAITIVLLDRSLGSGKLLRSFGADGNATATLVAPGTPDHDLPPFMPPENPVTDTPIEDMLPINSGTRAAAITSTLIRTAATPMRSPGLTFSPSSELTKTVTPTRQPAGVCGHALDVPFGGQIRFVLHRVRSGENLSLYADQHHTTTEAILAVNYRLPVPVWEHWILVIPLDKTVLSGVPPFEPYQALEAKLSLTDLADNLGADATTLQQYNAFDESCTSFSGWILVPREADPG